MTITEQLRRRGILFRLCGQELNVCCPFCSEHGETADTRYRLGINLQSNLGHCFNCGWSSRYALQAYTKRIRVDGVSVPAGVGPSVAPQIQLPADYHCLTTIRDELDQLAVVYLEKRMVSARQIRVFQIGVSFSGRYAWRIVFPLRWRKELRGFLARDFSGRQQAKYLNETGMVRSVFGLPDQAEEVVLFEGAFKALRAGRVLPVPCCAVLGNRITDGQVDQLQESGVRGVYYWPDPDGPGSRGARQSMMTLQKRGIRVQLVWPSVYADEVGLPEIKKVWLNKQGFGIEQNWKMRLYGRAFL